MNKKLFMYAEIINQACYVESTYNENTEYACVFVYDDDIMAVLGGVKAFFELKKKYPQIKLVIANRKSFASAAFNLVLFSLYVRRLFSSHIKKYYNCPKHESSSTRMSRVAGCLGVQTHDIKVIAEKDLPTTLQTMAALTQGQKALVVTTQRLAMLFKQESARCNKLDFDFLVIRQNVDEVQHWHNLMRAGDARMVLLSFEAIAHDLAIDSDDFKNASKCLRRWKWVHIFNYPIIFFSALKNAKNCIKSERKAIQDFFFLQKPS